MDAPNDSVVDGCASQWNTSSRNLDLRKTPSRSPTPSLVGGLRYDDFSASYRNPADTISKQDLGQLRSAPASALIFQPDELIRTTCLTALRTTPRATPYQFGNLGARTNRAGQHRRPRRRNRNGSKFELFERTAGRGHVLQRNVNERNTDPDTAAAQECCRQAPRHRHGIQPAGRLTP